jgi:hypothetical protein
VYPVDSGIEEFSCLVLAPKIAVPMRTIVAPSAIAAR